MVRLRNTFNMPLFEKVFFGMFSLYFVVRGLCTVFWAVLELQVVITFEKWQGVSISLEAFIVIGGVLAILAFFGGGFSILYFDNAKFRSRYTCISCTTVMFALLFLTMLIVQSAAASYMLVLMSRVKDAGYFEEAFRNYNYRTEDMKFVDHIQKTLNCCGIYHYTDYWYILNIPIPASCCYKWEGTCAAYEATKYSCAYKLACSYRIRAISIVALIVVVVELIGIIFALCLANSRRKRNAKMQN